MAVSDDYIEYITGQLADLEEIRTRRMFGGVGIFHRDRMFAKIDSEQNFYLKADEHNRAEFEARGMQPFYSPKKNKTMPYWQVPADIIEDRQELGRWARKAQEAADRAAR